MSKRSISIQTVLVRWLVPLLVLPLCLTQVLSVLSLQSAVLFLIPNPKSCLALTKSRFLILSLPRLLRTTWWTRRFDRRGRMYHVDLNRQETHPAIDYTEPVPGTRNTAIPISFPIQLGPICNPTRRGYPRNKKRISREYEMRWLFIALLFRKCTHSLI